MMKKERDISLFFNDLETAINNPDLYTTLTSRYVYTDPDDECGITVSSTNLMRDFGDDIFEAVRRVCLKHGMLAPKNDIIP